MSYESTSINGEKYSYSEKKRKETRVPFNLEIYYPNVNNNIDNVNLEVNTPVLKAINISHGGICFKSSKNFKVGDFISFLLKIDNKPSFPSLVEVRWIGISDEAYYIGCRFIKLEWYQIEQIQSYVDKNLQN